jgi:hypothetical protein
MDSNDRATRWMPVSWDDLRPGDVIEFVDEEGRHCARIVARRELDTIVTEPQMYSHYVLSEPVRVAHLTAAEIARYTARQATPPARFRKGERRRAVPAPAPFTPATKKKKKFRPRTL